MITIDEKIRAAIKVECDRQHVGEDRQIMLQRAYNFVHFSQFSAGLNDILLGHIAALIEPDNKAQFRTTPVYFESSMTTAMAADNVPRAMENWIGFFNELIIEEASDIRTSYVERCIRDFLDIHPFSDGNGRTAWLLRVWLLNQWDDPQPLPDYYGE